MNYDDIQDVIVVTNNTGFIYKVSMISGSVSWVPDNPDNMDWPIVVKWLNDHPKTLKKK